VTLKHTEEANTVAFMKEIFSYMSSSECTHSLLNSIHKSLKSVIYAENFFVVLLNSSEKYVSFPFYKDEIDDISLEQLNQVPLEEIFSTLTFYAIKKKKIVCLTRPQIEELLEAKEVKVIGTVPEQWVCFPLVHKDEFMGNFVVQSYRNMDEYSEQDVEILGFISNVIAAAIYLFNRNLALQSALNELEQHKENLEDKIAQRTAELESTLSSLQVEMDKSKKLQEKLSYEAFHDALTQLYNRKFLTDQLEIYASKASRTKQPVILAYLDLDGFKILNDTLGHGCGDKVLVETAHRLQQSFRRHDIVARFGGDEFVVLITTPTTHDDLDCILSRAVANVSAPIEYRGQSVFVGVSIGVAQSSNPVVIKSKLLMNADKALYQAKALGKGQFVHFEHLALVE